MTNRFEKNRHGVSTYTCRCCGKLTRETGHGESGAELCAFCWEEGGIENDLCDGIITPEQAAQELADLRKMYQRN